jgi:iron-sulfur cluster repair protein YtfE (RIC family)
MSEEEIRDQLKEKIRTVMHELIPLIRKYNVKGARGTEFEELKKNLTKIEEDLEKGTFIPDDYELDGMILKLQEYEVARNALWRLELAERKKK